VTRREALAGYAGLMASALRAQRLVGEAPGRIPPVAELLNALEFESVAERKLGSLAFAQIAGTERAALDRITFRPRMMVDTTKMDLSSELFGQSLFTPILVGPLAEQKRFHPEGEVAMMRGASAAKAVMVVSGGSSMPLQQIASAAAGPWWYQVYLQKDMGRVRTAVRDATALGCKVLCVTMGSIDDGATAGVDWRAIDQLRQGLTIPVVLKGVMSPEEAMKAISSGIQGIVVSSYSPRAVPGTASSIEVLASIATAVAGRVPVLVDGSIRLGGDVLKALALGAQAVLVGRPALWGLAAYGSDGVRTVVELIQSGFARDMAMCGKVNLKAIDRSVVTVHRR